MPSTAALLYTLECVKVLPMLDFFFFLHLHFLFMGLLHLHNIQYELGGSGSQLEPRFTRKIRAVQGQTTERREESVAEKVERAGSGRRGLETFWPEMSERNQ